MRRTPLIVLAALALVAGGCAGGDGGSSGGPFANVTQDDLAIMVLPPGELGGLDEGLEVDAEESGFAPNAEEAEDTIEPDDTGESLAEQGRQTGYELTLLDRDLSSVQSGGGVFSVASSAELFDDSDGALAYLEEQLDAYVRFDGEEIEDGVRLADVVLDERDGIGDEARVMTATIVVGDARLRAFLVAFQLDRIVGATLVIRADQEDGMVDAVGLAEDLETRIRRVAAGEVEEEPVPLPEPELEGPAPSA